MSSWVLARLGSNLSYLWAELMESWSAQEFKNFLRREAVESSSENNSKEVEEYSLITKMGVDPNNWIDSN